jgi:iron complex outermembrane receptor protein
MSMSSSKARQLGLRLAITILCAGGSAICTSRALGETATATSASEATATATDAGSLDEVIVTGSRQAGQKAADSPAPIQILSAESLAAASGNPDLMSTLAQIVPSLTMQAFGFDMSGQTLQARLRGLSPNHVLVLINGKRRHTTANIAVDTGSAYQGGAGVDLNFIPLDAIEHIEVLTDGAAAQYGTDAIAGVINIILKKNTSGGVVKGTYGQYGNDGGGKTEDVSANAGFEPGEGGYFNLTGQFHNHGHSNVGAIDERVVNPANFTSYPNSNLPNVPGWPYLNRIAGDGQQQSKLMLLNMGFDFEGGTELYSVITYGKKDASSYENYRLPSKADYTDSVTGATVVPYPFGFNPQETSAEDDYQLNVGIKGTIVGWNWDVGTGFGGDKVKISTIDTFSFQPQILGVPSPANFYDGSLQSTQWTTTADINKDFDVGLAGPLNVAFGAEYRRETYAIGAGVPYSWQGGGASSYPGFTPNDAGTNSRKNYAGYVDFAANPISGLRIDAAGRFEHYNDFGSATVGKLTGRYDFTPEFAVRGTVSNGFRAPTLAEEYYTSTNVGPTTAFVQLAPNSPAGKLLGLGDGLQAEHSVNLSLGLVWRPTPGMSTTLDVYQITITNRIVGSGQIIGENGGSVVSVPVNNAIVASGAPIDPAVLATGTTGVNVFANGIDTRTRGADLVFDFPMEFNFGKVVWSIGATYNKTTVTKYAATPAALSGGINPATGVPSNELYDPEAYSYLTTANPKYVVNLGALWTVGKFSVDLVEKIYGPWSQYDNDDGDSGGTGAGTFPACQPKPGTLFICPGNFDYFQTKVGATAITNLDLSYKMSEHVKFSLGALNLLNKFPPKLNATQQAHEDSFAYGDNAGVTQYPISSPFGINGGFYYVKGTYTF